MSKLSKHRNCPAAGREITSAECGEGRNSRFACPANCAFNPFSPENYERYLELEEDVDRQMLEQLRCDGSNPTELGRDMKKYSGGKYIVEQVSVLAWHCFFLTDQNGKTLVQRWEERGLQGLKHDHRVQLNWRSQAKVSLIEVRRVLSAEQVEVVDLLESTPTPIVIQDKSFARGAIRFTVSIGWTHPTPHFHRVIGALLNLPSLPTLEPRAVVDELCRHLGGPSDLDSQRMWLAENLPQVASAAIATTQARYEAMMDRLDTNFGRAFYELQVPFADFCGILGDNQDFLRETVETGGSTQGFTDAWGVVDLYSADQQEPGMFPGSVRRLGRVTAGSSSCKLEAMGDKAFTALSLRFESLMGRAVRLVSRSFEDLRHHSRSVSPPDLRLVPPALLENPSDPVIEMSMVSQASVTGLGKDADDAFMEAMNHRFLDLNLPTLEGRTPREATKDPKLRPMLVLLVKERIRVTDKRNREKGGKENLDWMLTELGLDELR